MFGGGFLKELFKKKKKKNFSLAPILIQPRGQTELAESDSDKFCTEKNFFQYFSPENFFG